MWGGCFCDVSSFGDAAEGVASRLGEVMKRPKRVLFLR